MIIETKGLTKRYRKFSAVEGIDLHVNKKDIYGILGPNGAGKSTTIGMLSGLLHMTSGDAFIFGYSVKKDFDKIQPRIGVLAQNVGYYPNKSALDHLIFYGRFFGLTKQECIKRGKELLRMVGLGSRMDDRLGSFSSGMKKRLGLAQALINKPELLILDEPTANLDYKTKKELFSVIKKVNKDATVFISSNDLGEIKEICTRVGILKNGRLMVEKTIKEVSGHTKTFEITVINPKKDVIKSLKKIKGVKKAELFGDKIIIDCDPKMEIAPLILMSLMKHKIKVLEARRTHTLEKLYLDSV